MRIIRNILIIVGVILVLYFGISALFGGEGSSGEFTTATIETSEGEFEFNLEVADTNSERRFGLNARSEISENEGMVYVFPKEDFWDMWTYDSNFEFDVIWLDEEQIVVDFFENLPPCENEDDCLSYFPSREANFAVEVKSGRVQELGVQVGDEFELGI